MSTLKVDAIRHNSATSDAITTHSDGTASAKIIDIGGGQISHRNLVINGAMNVAQRGVTSTLDNYGTVDRFKQIYSGQDEVLTQEQVDVASGTTPYSLGFRKAFKITNGNQTSGAGASDIEILQYKIEAQDIASSGWNYTSSSSFITLSFWVKASVAQSYTMRIQSQDGTRQNFPFEIGPLTANTWTKVTKKIPGNSNLQFDNDNGEGLLIEWLLFRGTNYTDNSISNDTWAAYVGSTRSRPVTSTWWTTNDATFEMTGVQLEVGDTATSFEHRSYDEELKRCKRYALVFGSNQAIGTGSAYNSTNINIHIYNQFRAAPTYSKTTGGGGYTWVVYYGASGHATASPTVSIAGDSSPNYCLRLYVQNCHTSMTAGQAVWALTHDGGGEQIVFSAEL